jgi:hypothetical protein
MAGYLSDSAIAASLAAIQGTTDTFMRQEVTFEQRRPKLSAFTDSRDKTNNLTTTIVLGLFIQGQQEVESSTAGVVDLGDGYVLCNRADLAAQALANEAGELTINAGTDTLRIAGVRYQILKAVPLGPLDGKYTLGKFITKKLLTDNHP